jgi:hypothetical protein
MISEKTAEKTTEKISQARLCGWLVLFSFIIHLLDSTICLYHHKHHLLSLFSEWLFLLRKEVIRSAI